MTPIEEKRVELFSSKIQGSPVNYLDSFAMLLTVYIKSDRT